MFGRYPGYSFNIGVCLAVAITLNCLVAFWTIERDDFEQILNPNLESFEFTTSELTFEYRDKGWDYSRKNIKLTEIQTTGEYYYEERGTSHIITLFVTIPGGDESSIIGVIRITRSGRHKGDEELYSFMDKTEMVGNVFEFRTSDASSVYPEYDFKNVWGFREGYEDPYSIGILLFCISIFFILSFAFGFGFPNIAHIRKNEVVYHPDDAIREQKEFEQSLIYWMVTTPLTPIIGWVFLSIMGFIGGERYRERADFIFMFALAAIFGMGALFYLNFANKNPNGLPLITLFIIIASFFLGFGFKGYCVNKSEDTDEQEEFQFVNEDEERSPYQDLS